jgi:hypothetical protein
MSDVAQAKQAFQSLMNARRSSREISIEEAKQRLREADPGVDVGRLVAALNQRDYETALAQLLVEIPVETWLELLKPLEAKALQALLHQILTKSQ